MRGTDMAHDPVNNVYLVLAGYGAVYGVFVNASGVPISSIFTIMNGTAGFGSFPRAEHSPHAHNGVGGQGAFLVTWHHNIGATNYVFGRLVSFNMPGHILSGIQQISDGGQGGSWWETGPAMAYSRTSRRFLVAWRTVQSGVQGRFVDTNGALVGSLMQLENVGGSRDPALAWNPAFDEFGLVYTGWNGSGAFAAFRRIRGSDGALSARKTFGFSAGTYATAIDVNTWNGRYVLTWALHPGTMSATFDAAGNQISSALVTTRFGHDQSLGLAFNNVSGTLLAVGSDTGSLEVAGAEVTGSGAPNTVAQILTNGAAGGSFYPLTTWRLGSNQWGVVYSRDFKGATTQIVATSTTGGGSGGGGGTTAPLPPASTGCSTPDPFVSLGGGTCVNGGWLPPGSGGSPTPTPSPSPAPPPSTGCTTPQPGAGWVCVNGGWLPPGHPGAAGAAPPPASTGGCTTPDPFAAVGGGACVNGGWVPRSLSCQTPDPFVSIGGGTCINGGWVPTGGGGGGGGCATPDPFVSTGGGSCVNGGWVPNTSTCSTPDPFVSVGGGVCINGGWVPRTSG